MPTPTYDLIASNVLSSSASSVEFTSISGYRDLIIVSDYLALSGTVGQYVTVNNNTSTIYSTVLMYGVGSGSGSSESSSGDGRTLDGGSASTTNKAMYHWQFLDANATDKHKTILFRSGRDNGIVLAGAARAATTSAITSIQVVALNGSFASGATFYLYGIVS